MPASTARGVLWPSHRLAQPEDSVARPNGIVHKAVAHSPTWLTFHYATCLRPETNYWRMIAIPHEL